MLENVDPTLLKTVLFYLIGPGAGVAVFWLMGKLPLDSWSSEAKRYISLAGAGGLAMVAYWLSVVLAYLPGRKPGPLSFTEPFQGYRVDVNVVFCDPLFPYPETYYCVFNFIGACNPFVSYPYIQVLINFSFRQPGNKYRLSFKLLYYCGYLSHVPLRVKST